MGWYGWGVIWGCVSDGYIYIYGTYIIYMYGICIYQDYIYIYMNYICTHLVVGELKTVMGWSVCVCVCRHHN